MSLAVLRDASWLTRRRIRDYATILNIAAVAILLWMLTGHGMDDPLGRPLGTDFVSFWTVSSALLHDQIAAIYDPAALNQLERAIAGDHTGFYAWLYPPIALLLVAPLAFLPYIPALALWLSAGLAAYLAALWRILPRPLMLWAGLAFPAVLVTIEHGQNAFVTSGLLAWGLLLLGSQPIAAGILFGLLSFKPQLGMLLPFALIAGGHWRAIASAAVTILILAGMTVLAFGIESWSGYVSVLPLAREVLDLGLVPHYKMQSVYAALRLLGTDASAAYGAQALAAMGALLAVMWVWRRRVDQEIKSAALLIAIPLATPFVLDYDLLLLAPAIAWLVRLGLRDGWRPWERIALGALAVDPLVARIFAQYSHLLLTPILLAAMLGLIVTRIRETAGDDARVNARATATGRELAAAQSLSPTARN